MEGHGKPARRQRRAEAHHRQQRYLSRRQGTVALARVATVLGKIEKVVQQVSARRAGRQGYKYPGRDQIRPGSGLVRSDEGNERECVLDPLVRTQGSKSITRAAAEAGKQSGAFIQCPHFPHEARREVDANNAPCASPHGEVAPFIADIVESTLAEALDQGGGLGLAGQIGAPVGGEPAGCAHRIGERRNDPLVGRRGQPDFASRDLGGGDLVEHRRVQHQRRRRQRHCRRDPALQRRAPLDEPDWKGEERKRGGREQPGGTLDQQIAFDQCAIDVDDQGRHA